MRNWLPFEEAREIIRNAELKRGKDYRVFIKSQSLNLPNYPNIVYDGWISWYDWLGINCIDRKHFLPFKNAIDLVKKYRFKNQKGYHNFVGKNLEIGLPYHPERTYKEQWISWYEWLGTKRISPNKKDFLPFKMAREIVRKYHFKRAGDYRKYSKNSRNRNLIPSAPNKFYKNNGWKSWQDWLGNDNLKYGRKYRVNDNFFKKWSHNMAYILGFWWADGCISKHGNTYRFSICQHKKDKYLLKLILNEMDSSYPLRNIKNVNACRIDIDSMEITKDIFCLGGKERKSLDIKFPKSIPKKYLSDFIRGVFDGDGCIMKPKKNTRHVSSICSGSKMFLKMLQRKLEENIKDFYPSLICRRSDNSNCSDLYILIFNAQNTIKFGQFIYNNINKYDLLKLNRKFKKFVTDNKTIIGK